MRIEAPVDMNKLFVYGIFLDERRRQTYGMTNPRYATVSGYITIGEHIVQAYPVDNDMIVLTGLLVDMNPAYWEELDALEGGYDRIIVQTTRGVDAYMYVAKER